jgi:hypothetical protein
VRKRGYKLHFSLKKKKLKKNTSNQSINKKKERENKAAKK